jgi:tetratricopeptide (TPR) repeat protein
MFFPRLRNQAKWAFIFLILVFGGGFIFLGVGSGGLDIGQLLRDAIGSSGTSTGSVSKAQEAVRKRPFSAPAHRQLPDVLEKKGRVDEAVVALEEYVKLRPRDTTVLRHLGQLELGQADRYFREAQLAALAQQESGANSVFTPGASSKLGQALSQNPIANAMSTQANSQLQDASVKYQAAAGQAVATYQRIVKLNPDDQQALFSLAQAADTLRKPAVAINAYTRLLKLNLDPATAAQIRERVKTLRQSTATAGG